MIRNILSLGFLAVLLIPKPSFANDTCITIWMAQVNPAAAATLSMAKAAYERSASADLSWGTGNLLRRNPNEIREDDRQINYSAAAGIGETGGSYYARAAAAFGAVAGEAFAKLMLLHGAELTKCSAQSSAQSAADNENARYHRMAEARIMDERDAASAAAANGFDTGVVQVDPSAGPSAGQGNASTESSSLSTQQVP